MYPLIKFRTERDRDLFLLEVGEPLGNAITQEMYEKFLTNRGSLIAGLKDFRKGKDTEAAWRHNRLSFMRGIRKWHKSSKGKMFHRKLARFLRNRILRPKYQFLRNHEALSTLSFIKSYLYMDLDYYRSLNEEIEYLELLEYVIPIIESVEVKIRDYDEDAIDDEELDTLIRVVYPSDLEIENIYEVMESGEWNDVTKYYALDLLDPISE